MLATLLALTLSQAELPALEIKGISIGNSDATLSALGNTTNCWRKEGVYSCEWSNLTYAGVKVEATSFALDKKVCVLTLNFDASFSKQVLSGLIKKFGKPADHKTGAYANALGNRWYPLQVTWGTGDTKITFEERTKKQSIGSVSMGGSKCYAQLLSAMQKPDLSDM